MISLIQLLKESLNSPKAIFLSSPAGSEKSFEDKNKVWDILKPSSINEDQTTDRQLLLDQIKSLTEYMISKGIKIQPLPKLKIIDNDEENAKDFFGKTAYYDPNQKLIVLYIKGRDLKSLINSYSHEMIHHKQNLEGRLKGIRGNNVLEDDKLDEIEREAYESGGMILRKYKDFMRNNTKKSFMQDLHESLIKPFL